MDIIAQAALGRGQSQQFQNSLVSMAVSVFAGFGASIHCHLSWIIPAVGPVFGKIGMLVETLGCFEFFRFLLVIRRRVIKRKEVICSVVLN